MHSTQSIPNADSYRPEITNSLSSRRFADPRGSPPKKSSTLNPNHKRNHAPTPMHLKKKRPSPLNPIRFRPPPVNEFKYFSHLPLSIQERILSILLAGAQTLIVKLELSPNFLDEDRHLRLNYVAAQPLPATHFGLKALLATSQATRQFALKHYSPLLSSGLSEVYFSPKIDTLQLSENDFHRFVWAKGLNASNESETDKKVENLCLTKYLHDRYKDGTYRQLTRFAGLKNLLLEGFKGMDDKDAKKMHEAKLEMEWRRAGNQGRIKIAECEVIVLRKREIDRMR